MLALPRENMSTGGFIFVATFAAILLIAFIRPTAPTWESLVCRWFSAAIVVGIWAAAVFCNFFGAAQFRPLVGGIAAGVVSLTIIRQLKSSRVKGSGASVVALAIGPAASIAVLYLMTDPYILSRMGVTGFTAGSFALTLTTPPADLRVLPNGTLQSGKTIATDYYEKLGSFFNEQPKASSPDNFLSRDFLSRDFISREEGYMWFFGVHGFETGLEGNFHGIRQTVERQREIIRMFRPLVECGKIVERMFPDATLQNDIARPPVISLLSLVYQMQEMADLNHPLIAPPQDSS